MHRCVSMSWILVLIFSLGFVISFEYKISLKSLQCKSLAKEVVVINCSVTHPNQTTNLINIVSDVTKPMTEVTVRNELFYKYSVAYKPLMINQTENFCAYMDGDIKSAMVLNLILQTAKKHMENFKCPIMGRVAIRHYDLQVESYLGLMPQGEYRLDTTFMENGKPYELTRFFFNYVHVRKSLF